MSAIPTLYTPRLCLRPFTLADAARVRQLAGDARIASVTTNVPHPYPEGAAEYWIAGHAPAAVLDTQWEFAITLAGTRTPGREHDLTDTGHLIGAVSLSERDDPEQACAELGYWIGVSYWNKGFATEAAHAILAFAFTKRGFHRVSGRHFAVNAASGRVLHKLGMQPDDALHSWKDKNGRSLEILGAAIQRDHWLRKTHPHKLRAAPCLQPA